METEKKKQNYTGLNELETRICKAIIPDTKDVPSLTQFEVAIYSKAVAAFIEANFIPKILDNKINYVKITSERFNGMSGDTVTLYDVANFIRDLHAQWTNGHDSELKDFMKELAALKAENERLKQWKAEHGLVNEWWCKVDEFIRQHPDATLGKQVSHEALRFLKQRDDLIGITSSMILSMRAHPDCIKDSEFADLSSIAEIILDKP